MITSGSSIATCSKSGSFKPPRLANFSSLKFSSSSPSTELPSPLGKPIILSSKPNAANVDATPRSITKTLSEFLGSSTVSLTASVSESLSVPNDNS